MRVWSIIHWRSGVPFLVVLSADLAFVNLAQGLDRTLHAHPAAASTGDRQLTPSPGEGRSSNRSTLTKRQSKRRTGLRRTWRGLDAVWIRSPRDAGKIMG